MGAHQNLARDYARILEIIADDPSINVIMPAGETNHSPTGAMDGSGSWNYPPKDPLNALLAIRKVPLPTEEPIRNALTELAGQASSREDRRPHVVHRAGLLADAARQRIHCQPV